MPMPSQTSNTNVGKFFTGDNGYTIYADCHGLNRAVYQSRQNKRPHWGTVIETEYEEFGNEESYDSEEDVDEQEGISEQEDQEEARVQFMELEEEQRAAENEAVRGDDPDIQDLFAGVQSLI